MGDTRFSHGLAFGRYGNFYSRTDGLIAEGDTTPDVTNGNLFYTNNTSETVITDFEFSVPGGGAATNSQQFEGKKITVVFLDSSTGLAQSTGMLTATSDGLQGANNSVDLIYHNSAWIEQSRSVNESGILVPLAGSTGSDGVLDARGKHLVITEAIAGSAMLIRTAINGYQGQKLTIVNAGSSTSITVNSAANDTFVSSTSAGAIATYVMENSSAIQFVRVGAKWWELRTMQSGSISWLL